MHIGDLYDPSLRAITDVGTEPSITLVGRATPRTSPESEQTNPSPGDGDGERTDAPVIGSRLIRCEHPGCMTMLVPDGRKPGELRTMCSLHLRQKRSEAEGKRRRPSLSTMIRRANRRD